MDDTVLTPAELQELSGYKKAYRIRSWLDSNCIKYICNGRGWPLVSKAVMRLALGETTMEAPPRVERSINLQNLNKAASSRR
ncbi:DUF4224 domain-containing protein [Aquitalea aquatica]|uniref:DUF4224 domain-containing protein n=1 Tax=Aquitalea aquatica TaxID=3044273 RepID=A0A838YDB6_9NEIS|nr:DUF4224 domain-containing protein [Aquitalea magnusonii]MBA4710509.1 DUF4224 domain-containing protein [Aquitalea magnusonii]